MVLRFSNVAKLVEAQNDMRLMSVISSVSCLRIMAEANTNTEVSHIIDIVNEFRVCEKYLTLRTPEFDIFSLQNKTMNSNIMILQQLSGILFFEFTIFNRAIETNQNYQALFLHLHKRCSAF